MKKYINFNYINIIIQLNKHILMKRTIIFIFIGENGYFTCYNLILKHIYFFKYFCITSRNYSTNVLSVFALSSPTFSRNIRFVRREKSNRFRLTNQLNIQQSNKTLSRLPLFTINYVISFAIYSS